MASLSAHLRRPDDHERLAFHPECPLCCGERLAGALPPEAVVGRRTQALLAAGVLALSAVTPTAVLAAEPDQQHEGATAPDQVAADAPPSTPAFDPGGEPTDLPFDAGPAPQAQAVPEPADDAGPLEQEPATNEDAPAADLGDGSTTEGAGQQEAPPASDPPPLPPAAEPPAPQPPAPQPPAPQPPTSAPPSAPAAETPAAAPAEPDADSTAPARPRKKAPQKHRQAHATVPYTVQAVPGPQAEAIDASRGASAPTTVHVEYTQTAATSASAVTTGQAAQRGDRVHAVLPGESLWSIARDLLGDGASTARIAREVNRLWERNSTRIGTGDRDLLMVGTGLALR